MATQSQAPPSDDNPPKPDLTQATTENQQYVQAEAPKQNSPTSVFVNSEPMREEQVQNAVKFLSHPKVRGSPVMYRRSFLEKKGLTKEEIDEAFRRVPDPSPSVQASGGIWVTYAGNPTSIISSTMSGACAQENSGSLKRNRLEENLDFSEICSLINEGNDLNAESDSMT